MVLKKWKFVCVICIVLVNPLFAGSPNTKSMSFTNSLGMEMISIDAGKFIMGSDLSRDYWDERPAHEVSISNPFYISQSEVTIEQYQKFNPKFKGTQRFGSSVCGVSWYDAMEFCKWLSEKESKPYRLPTEAEWEYVCRGGTKTLYASGRDEPANGWSNQWGVKNMHSGVREWCYDWYGDYQIDSQTDPVGGEYGMARVVRGGCLDEDSRFEKRKIFNASASRASIAPSFGMINNSIKHTETKADVQAGSVELNYTKGLIGTWFGGSNLTAPKEKLVITRLDDNWINDGNRGKSWSARWRGYIEAPYTGEVTFTMKVSTGGKLNIAGRDVIDHWEREGTYTGKLKMIKGEKYPITLSYNRKNGDTYLRLSWSWPGEKMHLVPDEAISYTQKELQLAESESGNNDIPSGPSGGHWIGFRVVQGAMPTTNPTPSQVSYAKEGVRKNIGIVNIGPDSTRPYFRKRYLLPVPLDNSSNEEIDAVGMHPSFRHHNHSPALEVCPNGDVMMIIYTSYHEYEPGVSLIASRLRFGSDQWDMPDRMFDFAAVNDHAPMLWTDGSKVHFFWGNPKLDGGFPFQWTSSNDSGATWDEVKFPLFTNMIGSHSRQPINTALRDKDGTIYIASDGSGGQSVLWASSNNGKTWFDTEGRSAGRHTTYALLKDGKTILGMGGKNTDIDGYMPKAISPDGGKTWTVSKTPFAAQGTNQRPSVLRLQSGRLFFAGDFQHLSGQKPDAVKQDGSYVALSDDDGQTWTIKPLIGAQPHERPRYHNGHPTLGYSAARQGPNGMIHLIATMNRPCLHFEFNEAWILSKGDSGNSPSDTELMASPATSINGIKEYKETYPDGKPKIIYTAGIANDGRFLMHGKETWFYVNGKKQREATYKLGKKIGKEIYLSQDGHVQWQWQHKDNGASTWTQYWPNGQKKSSSSWQNFKCHGTAMRWDINGKLISKKEFVDGLVQ